MPSILQRYLIENSKSKSKYLGEELQKCNLLERFLLPILTTIIIFDVLWLFSWEFFRKYEF